MHSTSATSQARAVKFTRQAVTDLEPELWGVGARNPKCCTTYVVFALKISALVVLWWTAAIVVTMTIKACVGSKGKEDAIFPYPFALTGMSNTTVGLLSLLCLQVEKLYAPPAPAMTRRELLNVLIIGCMQGVEIGLINKCLSFLTLSQRTMLNSLNVLFMMVTALCWRLEGLGPLKLVAVLCLTFGGACQGFDNSDNGGYSAAAHLTGVLLILTAMFIGTQRWAVLQYFMQYSAPDSALGQLSKLGLMSMIMPVTGTVCGILAIFSEPDAYQQPVQPYVALLIALVAVGVMALSFAELKIVHLTSSVAMSVLSTIHQIPIALSGVLFLDEHVSLWGAIGFGLCLMGGLFYVAARNRDAAVNKDIASGWDEEEMLVDPDLFGMHYVPNSPSDALTSGDQGSRRPSKSLELDSLDDKSLT